MQPFSLVISRTDMNRLAVIFAEGDTEADFYKKPVSYYRNQHGEAVLQGWDPECQGSGELRARW